MRLIFIILAIAFVVLIASFAALNAVPVKVNYIVGTKELPLAIVCFITLVVGLVVGALIMLVKLLAAKQQNLSLSYKLKKAEHKLAKAHELAIERS